MKQDRLICNKNLPVFSLESKNAPCEAKLLSHSSSTPCDVKKTSCSDVWVELHSPNTWLSVCCGACTLRTVCDNDVTTYATTSSSIVTLKQGCLLQSNDFTIYSRNQYNTNMKMESDFNIALLNTTVNKIVNLTYHNIPWEIQQRTEESQDIDRRLLFQKEREILPETISTHDLHQYAICYTLLAFAIIITIIWVFKKYLPDCSKNKRVRSRETHNEDIELQQRPIQERAIQKAPSLATSAVTTTTSTAQVPRQLSPTEAKDNIAFTFDE